MQPLHKSPCTVIAPPLARRIGAGRASTALFLCSGPSALLIACPGSGRQVGLTAAGLLLVGVAVVGGNVIRGAWRQRYVPAELMGRVLTTSQLVNTGTMPLAGLAAGAWAPSSVSGRPCCCWPVFICWPA